MPKQRVDRLLVDRGLIDTRAKAQAVVMAGLVFAGPHADKRIDKPGQAVAEDVPLTVKGQDHPWVGRGGLKLDHALTHFGIDVTEAVTADIGSSTGGFTDVLLSRGAAKVFAVDVGTNQLAWKLRTDDRVVVLEKTNARHLTAAEIPEAPTVVVSDVSFISLTLALPAILGLAVPGARLIALIKPQFEAGRAEVGKGGIVRDPAVRRACVDKIETWLTQDMGWRVDGLVESPIAGADGNVEVLIAATKP